MYYSPARRGGHLAGVRARQIPTGAHRGTVREFLRRHERDAIAAARGSSMVRKEFLGELLSRTADSRNLRFAWEHLATVGGQAPGQDGLHYGDLGETDVWTLCRTLRAAILDDTYRPGPDQKVSIPKVSGKGTRTLCLPSIIDRVVQRAIVQTVEPFLDPQFDADSFGFRPGRDRRHALARAETLATTSNRWCWVAEDIRDAFDNVPQERLLDVVRLWLPDEGITRLIGRVVRTETGQGLRQGGCLSPLLLNLYLGHLLDPRWRKRYGHRPLLRYADDLLVLAPSEGEAHQAWTDLNDMLRPTGMSLKGSPLSAVRDLAGGDNTEWLGYRVSKRKDSLVVRLADRSWNSLRAHLELTHTEPDSPLRAVEVIGGWVDQLGPCYVHEDRQGVYARVRETARQIAFDEILSPEKFLDRWEQAFGRWNRIRSTAV